MEKILNQFKNVLLGIFIIFLAIVTIYGLTIFFQFKKTVFPETWLVSETKAMILEMSAISFAIIFFSISEAIGNYRYTLWIYWSVFVSGILSCLYLLFVTTYSFVMFLKIRNELEAGYLLLFINCCSFGFFWVAVCKTISFYLDYDDIKTLNYTRKLSAA